MGTANTKMQSQQVNDYKLLRKWQGIIREYPIDSQLKFGTLRYCDLRPVTNSPVHLVVTGEKASYKGLMQCGSMWSCPLCTPRRLRVHAAKITAIIKHQKDLGNQAFMLTLTLPHRFEESASTLINRLFKTKYAFRSQKTVHKSFKKIQSIGSVSSVECTYSGFNGYHFHVHWLIFIPKKNWHMVEEFADICKKYWLQTFYRLFPNAPKNSKTRAEYSVYLSRNKDGTPMVAEIGDYICGWGIDRELCKTSNKEHPKKRAKSAQMFELLESDNPRDHEVFAEYALATKGHNRISYSRNLQQGIDLEQALEDYFKLIEKKTRDHQKPTGTRMVCSFTYTNWNNIVRDEFFKKIPHLQNMLDIATAGGDYLDINKYLRAHNLPECLEPYSRYIRPWQKRRRKKRAA